jgi:hypothetical protein
MFGMTREQADGIVVMHTEHLSRTGALINLLIGKGLITEAEFETEVAKISAAIDQAVAKAKDEASKEIDKTYGPFAKVMRQMSGME